MALKKISGELCTKHINHTHKFMNEWLQTDEAGTLKKHGSLDALRALSPEERLKCTDLNMEGDGLLVGGVELDKKNQQSES